MDGGNGGGEPGGVPAPGRRDAIRNYHRIVEAAREVLAESGTDAGMEEIAARAGVGVGTVYRRFASKDALFDELLRLSLDELAQAADQALASPGGIGLEQFLRALGAQFARYERLARLLLERRSDTPQGRRVRAAIAELTARARAAGTLSPGVTAADVNALIWAMRGLTDAFSEAETSPWERFLDIHLAGLRAAPAAP